MEWSGPSEVKQWVGIVRNHALLTAIVLLIIVVLIAATYAIHANAAQQSLVRSDGETAKQLNLSSQDILFEKPIIVTSSQNTESPTSTSPVSSQSTQTQTPDSTTQQNTTVRINGAGVSLPSSGELHKEIRSGGNKATIDLSVGSNNSSSNHSSVDINVQSSTDSTTSKLQQ